MTTCLVVDDSRIVRRVARTILEGAGFAVEEAADGREALARCAEGLPAVLLVDWHMPVMDGLAFVEALRRLPGGRDPKVVMCTTENGPAAIAQALAAGADEFIMKPFDGALVRGKLALVGVL